MSNRVVIQEGYTLPFAAYGRRKRRTKSKRRSMGMAPSMKKQQNVMKACAKAAPGGKSYRPFMKRCLKAGGPRR